MTRNGQKVSFYFFNILTSSQFLVSSGLVFLTLSFLFDNPRYINVNISKQLVHKLRLSAVSFPLDLKRIVWFFNPFQLKRLNTRFYTLSSRHEVPNPHLRIYHKNCTLFVSPSSKRSPTKYPESKWILIVILECLLIKKDWSTYVNFCIRVRNTHGIYRLSNKRNLIATYC